MGNSMADPQKEMKIELPHAITLPGMHPKEMKLVSCGDT